jgi:hypothetical protein
MWEAAAGQSTAQIFDKHFGVQLQTAASTWRPKTISRVEVLSIRLCSL